MQITLFSFLSAVLWSSFWIVAIYLLRRTRLKQYLGISSIALSHLFCLVRLLLPLEFPHVIIIDDWVIYARMYYNLFRRNCDILADRPICLVLYIVWLLGCCGFLFRYIRQYHRAIKSIEWYAAPWDGRTQAMLEQVQRQTGRTIQIQGYIVANIESAFSVGVLHKRIILPDRDYTETDLRYILLHEYTHFLHHDTVIKLLVALFCMIFWWNPAMYLLQKDLEQILEMKCDQSVAKILNPQERAVYLRTIISLMKQSDRKRRLPFDETALFQSDAEAALKERFTAVMMYSERPGRRIASVAFTGVCTTLFLTSYAVQLQPAFDPPPDDTYPGVYVERSNAYLLCDPSETYWLCVDGMKPVQISAVEAEYYQQDRFKTVTIK